MFLPDSNGSKTPPVSPVCQKPASIDGHYGFGAPYKESYVSIVFPVAAADGSPAVPKVPFPHAESEQEALRRWNGEGVAQLRGQPIPTAELVRQYSLIGWKSFRCPPARDAR